MIPVPCYIFSALESVRVMDRNVEGSTFRGATGLLFLLVYTRFQQDLVIASVGVSLI
jgi:hypothetical protein